MTELERFKVILATICLEHDDMKLGDALLLAEEIDTRMDDLPPLGSVEVKRSSPFDPMSFTESTPHVTVDTWLRTQYDIGSMPKINGIKEIRARTGMGLKAAKDAHERVFPLP